MIIAWAVFIVGIICSSVWLISCLFDDKEERTQRKSVLNFWLWFVVTSCSAQFIWG